jgi:nicotinate-nucleotide adenylyltransferase
MPAQKRIGLFFGTFNPIHTGHMIIAEYMAALPDIDQVWFVVSPHNPLKDRATLANDFDRLHMVRLAIDDNAKLRASNIEFSLPKPSYTIDTMAYLHEKYPEHHFSLIMGSDNIQTIHKWKNFEVLIGRYTIHIYDRPGAEEKSIPEQAKEIIFHPVPLLHISSTYIRQRIAEGLSVRYMVPDSVYQFLDGSTLYKQ